MSWLWSGPGSVIAILDFSELLIHYLFDIFIDIYIVGFLIYIIIITLNFVLRT